LCIPQLDVRKDESAVSFTYSVVHGIGGQSDTENQDGLPIKPLPDGMPRGSRYNLGPMAITVLRRDVETSARGVSLMDEPAAGDVLTAQFFGCIGSFT
jgi:hypothetical protein